MCQRMRVFIKNTLLLKRAAAGHAGGTSPAFFLRFSQTDPFRIENFDLRLNQVIYPENKLRRKRSSTFHHYRPIGPVMTKLQIKTGFCKCFFLGILISLPGILMSTALAQTIPLSERPANIRSSDALVYHGKILRPDGKVVTGALSVQIEIFSPEPSVCLLWTETQNLTAQNGAFSLELGYPENRKTGASQGAASSFRDVFLNNPSATISSATCQSGTSYTPTVSDDRLMKATFIDGETVVTAEFIPIKSVPFAMQAREIGGYGVNNIVKVSGAGSSSIVLSPDELSRLKNFAEASPSVLGTSNQVLGMNSGGSSLEYKSITAGSNVTITHSAGGIEISASGGGGGGSGSVVSVGVGGLPLSVGGSTASPVVSIAQASSSAAGYISASDWALFNNKQPAGNYLTTVGILDIKSTQGANPAWFNVSGACPSGQNIGYNSVTDRMECGGFTLTTSQVTTALGFTPLSGVVAADVSSALGYMPVNKTGDAMTGALSLPSNGLSVGTNQFVMSGGNVGIGTTSPSYLFQVESSSTSNIAKKNYRQYFSGSIIKPQFCPFRGRQRSNLGLSTDWPDFGNAP